jgi:hypothetical protein
MRKSIDIRHTLFSAAISTLLLPVILAPGCSFVTNETAIQCTSEAECLALGPAFAGTTCDKATKSCKKVADTEGRARRTKSASTAPMAPPRSVGEPTASA